MPIRKEKNIGVLGGMGPEATLDLFQKIIKYTNASKDQDHLRIVIDNNPKIPDRTPAVLGTGENILPSMVETARNLERAGADFIVIPCVTAHYFLDDLRKEVDIPIISIVDELENEIEARFPHIRKVGLISTTGTIKGKVFHIKLEETGREVLVPSDKDQRELVMEAIYGKTGIKAGYTNLENKKRVVKVAETLIERGAQGIIAGCTEIPLVLKEEDISVPLFDTLLTLARAAIREAIGRGSK
jgi:aspartate racemase